MLYILNQCDVTCQLHLNLKKKKNSYVLELEFKSKESNFTTPVYNLYSKEPSSEVKQKEGES